MRQTHDESTQNLAERLCWEVARRDDSRVARRLYRKQAVDGVYRLDEGAVLDDCFHFLQSTGVMALLEQVHGVAIRREMVPYVQSVLLYGLKTLFGIKTMHALPPLLCSDEAVMQLVGFNAQQVRQGICQRGAAKRQGERTLGPISPETLANHIVKLSLRDLEFVFDRAIRALAKAGVVSQQGTGMADGTDLETTERDTGCGQVTRQVRLEDTWGNVPEIEVTVYGWKVLLLIDAVTQIPLAVKVGPIQEHEARWARALVTQARMHLAGDARLSTVVCDQSVLDGTTLWWLDQQGIRLVVPAKTNMAVTAEARAQAAAGEDLTVGRRGHTVRHGQGKDDGPGGKTVFLTNAPVEQPLQPFDDDDDRRLMEHCWIKAAKQQGDLGPPPQKTERAVRVPVMFTLLLCALGTAYRLPCAREATGGEPVGWQRWRRQLLEQTRDQVIVLAQGDYGIFHLAEYSLLVGVKRKDRPRGMGTRQDVLATYKLMTRH